MEELRTHEGQSLKNNGWVWGIALIVMGIGFFVGQIMGLRADDLLPIFMMSGIGATFFVVYWTNIEKRLWALIVACVMWAAAGAIFFDEFALFNRWEDVLVPAYVMTFLSVPFLEGYRRSRKFWLLIVPVIFAATIGGIVIDALFWYPGPLSFMRRYADAVMGMYITSVLSVPFLVAFFRTRKNWLLIPPVLGAVVAGGVTLDTLIYGGPLTMLRHTGDEIIGSYIMFVISIPFGYLYMKDRSRTWALIIGGISISIATALLITGFAPLIPVVLIGFGVFLLARQGINHRRTTSPDPDPTPAYEPIGERPQV